MASRDKPCDTAASQGAQPVVKDIAAVPADASKSSTEVGSSKQQAAPAVVDAAEHKLTPLSTTRANKLARTLSRHKTTERKMV